MNEDSDMPFGKYAGRKMKDVPTGYLIFLYNKGIISIKNWNRVYWYVKEKCFKRRKG
jgi:hypothetical protein